MMFNDKVVLITGGTGSFGNQLTKTISDRYNPGKIIIYSRDEHKQYIMEQEFSGDKYKFMRYFIGDVRDEYRLRRAFEGVDYVIHAAALKHVPTAEYNPFECVRTNINGAENIVNAAIDTGVKKVIALSTDKACNPVNLYGATKLVSDKIFIAGNSYSGKSKTRFSVVRYGNVIGSRGSVIPYFQKLIDDGADTLPITDDRMTRFWITLQHGVDFVINCLSEMVGGEVFVPKIPSMKVTELATNLAPGIKTKVIGIRPGEKLHEEMISIDDALMTVEAKDHYVIQPLFPFWDAKQYEKSKNTKPVASNFKYDSESNTEWMSKKELLDVLKDL